MRRRIIFVSYLGAFALALGLANKYVPHASPFTRIPIGEWASAHYLVDAGRPDIAARRLQEDVQRGAALKQRAAVWQSVLLAGMGEACMQLSGFYKAGALRQPALAGQFFGYFHEYGNCAKRYAIELGDILADRASWLGESPLVTLESNPPLLESDQNVIRDIERGVLPDKTAALKLYSHQLQTGVSAVLHRMSPHGAREVPARVFLATMRSSLEALSSGVGEPKRSELLRIAANLLP